MKVVCNFNFERALWKKGFKVVAGADEVGRGAWAGPVVASAVAFAPISNFQFSIFKSGIRIDDSKKLTPRQREKAEVWIKENCLAWGVGEAPVSVINKKGLVKATEMAFRGAVAACGRRLQSMDYSLQSTVYSPQSGGGAVVCRPYTVDFLLVDAFYLPYIRGLRRRCQKAIVKGDEKSLSIAAASILAKVYRDRLMGKLGQKHRAYGWERNKGYGTREHTEVIKQHGATRLHRKGFVSNINNVSNISNIVISEKW